MCTLDCVRVHLFFLVLITARVRGRTKDSMTGRHVEERRKILRKNEERKKENVSKENGRRYFIFSEREAMVKERESPLGYCLHTEHV